MYGHISLGYLNFVVHGAASLVCSWKKTCSQRPLKLGEFSGLIALVLSLFLNVTSVGEVQHRRAATALEPGAFTDSGQTLLPLTQRFWRVFLDNLCSTLFVCEIVTEKCFWKSGDLCPENLWREYKVPEKAGKLFRQVFWHVGFKQVPEAQNFQHSKASSTAKGGEGNVKWC